MSPLNEHFDMLKTFNWEAGVQVSKTILLLSLSMALRFERLENEDNVFGFNKWLFDKERYSSDVKLDSWDWEMFPLK